MLARVKKRPRHRAASADATGGGWPTGRPLTERLPRATRRPRGWSLSGRLRESTTPLLLFAMHPPRRRVRELEAGPAQVCGSSSTGRVATGTQLR